MKAFFISIALLFCSMFIVQSYQLFGQHYTLPENMPKYDRKPYHFGFVLGVNNMNFVSRSVEDLKLFDTLCVIESEPQMGFTIGIVSNLRLWTDYADLRFIPSLSFGERRLLYTLKNNNRTLPPEVKRIESTSLDFPFELKLKSMRFFNNCRAYVLAGIKYNFDLASQAKQKDVADTYVVKLKRNDYAYELGVGFDIYLVYFKFGTELKMSYGMKDLLKRDNNVYTDSITKLSSKIFMLSFTFE